jgi:hypothetical protein
MRRSRLKQAAPGLYPENTPGYKKPPPEPKIIRGVPAEFAIKVVDHILRWGDPTGKTYAAGRADYGGQEERHEPIRFANLGGVLFDCYMVPSFGMHHRVYLSGPTWSCTLFVEHWMMGGADCHMIFGKYFAVADYEMRNKRGWLMDMTIARMMVADWARG